MNFKFRFALLFSLSVFIILAITAIYISIVNEEFRQNEFYGRLVDEAKKASTTYFHKNLPEEEARQRLRFNVFSSLPEENVAILDSNAKVIYATPDGFNPILQPQVLKSAKANQVDRFTKDKRETVVFFDTDPFPHYIYVSAFDRYGRSKANNLIMILVVSVIGGLVLSAVLAFFYVKQIIKPLNSLKLQMQRINEQNLTERLSVNETSDELNSIAKNFNDMLDRLENAFETRKSFVQHASHELRTPMANMLSQTEVALNQDLSKEEYRNILQSLKEDQQDMISLTNSLLLLSQYETGAMMGDWKMIRIDELLYETIDITKNVYRNAIISVDFEELPEDENLLLFKGNELLIKSAFQNLIRNACNYSEDNLVTISINAQPTAITVNFNNRGRQLSADEQQRLFIPFFRGYNSTNKKGFGLGLSIVQRILTLHKAQVYYKPLQENLNRFVVVLPKTNQ